MKKLVPAPITPVHFVYILRCSDGTYYVGHSADIAARLVAHQQGGAAEYTKVRRPVALVYQETAESVVAAAARERQLKKWSRAKKEALIGGDLPLLRELSRRRTR